VAVATLDTSVCCDSLFFKIGFEGGVSGIALTQDIAVENRV
jgi:hypothetical protein